MFTFKSDVILTPDYIVFTLVFIEIVKRQDFCVKEWNFLFFQIIFHIVYIYTVYIYMVYILQQQQQKKEISIDMLWLQYVN